MRPPTASELDLISARIELAEQVLASGYGSFTAGGAELSNQRAIAHALIAIAQCARIAIAKRTESAALKDTPSDGVET